MGFLILYGSIVLVLAIYVIHLHNRLMEINLKIQVAMRKVEIGRDDFYSDLVDIKELTD